MRMHSGYTWLWLAVLLQGVAIEVVAWRRRGPGDTLSEHVWKLMVGPAGLAIYALLAWVFLWHFPWGKGKPLGWQDGLAVAVGVALWLVVRKHAADLAVPAMPSVIVSGPTQP
jgi:hypothetical protein